MVLEAGCLFKDAQDNEECTPLMHAVRDGCDECVLKLLELGADRTIENRDRETALDIAKDYQNMRIIHYLEVRTSVECFVFEVGGGGASI